LCSIPCFRYCLMLFSHLVKQARNAENNNNATYYACSWCPNTRFRADSREFHEHSKCVGPLSVGQIEQIDPRPPATSVISQSASTGSKILLIQRYQHRFENYLEGMKWGASKDAPEDLFTAMSAVSKCLSTLLDQVRGIHHYVCNVHLPCMCVCTSSCLASLHVLHVLE